MRPQLRRVLGKWDLAAIGVNQVVGSAVFVLPASVAALVGSAASPLAWCLAAGVNALIILCFAEAASRFQDAGGPYLYARSAFGSFAGFQVGWLIWLTRVTTQAALANAFVMYMTYFLPGIRQGNPRSMLLITIILLLTIINILGVRQGSWVVNLCTLGKLTPLLAFIFVGVFYVDWSTFGCLARPSWGNTGETALLLMFAFGGYELTTLPAGEASLPRRDVPRALLLTIGAVSSIYFFVQLVAAGTLPELAASQTPLSDAAARFWGPVAGSFTAAGALISIAGSSAGSMLAGPRVTFAMAERGQLPSWLGHINLEFRTPEVSILAYSGVSLLLALSGTFVQMAMLSAVTRLVVYIATCSAVPVLRRRHPDSRRNLAGRWTPFLAVGCSALLLLGADFYSLAAGGLAVTSGSLIYLLQSRRRSVSS